MQRLPLYRGIVLAIALTTLSLMGCKGSNGTTGSVAPTPAPTPVATPSPEATTPPVGGTVSPIINL